MSSVFIVIAAFTTALFFLVVSYAISPTRRKAAKQRAQKAEINKDIVAINNGRCPDCGTEGELLSGPSGGMSQNVGCNHCLMEFNVGFGFGTGAFMVDRTGKMDESRARIFGIQSEEYREIVKGDPRDKLEPYYNHDGN